MIEPRRYTPEQIEEFEESGELCVCQSCDLHGHVDDFGDYCPACGEYLGEDDDPASMKGDDQ